MEMISWAVHVGKLWVCGRFQLIINNELIYAPVKWFAPNSNAGSRNSL
jgi:hypothetical protein